jgi:uncharacterized membrane protein (DUF485 family)
MFPRPDRLLGTALYVALGAAAFGAAWLLVDVLGGAVSLTLPVGAGLLFR